MKNKIDFIYNLIGIYENDIWNLRKCGMKNIEECIGNKVSSYAVIDFNRIKNWVVKKEIKYYVYEKLINFKGSYDSLRENYIFHIKWIIKFLESNSESIKSLFETTEEDSRAFKEFLIQNKVRVTYTKKDYVTKVYTATIVNSLNKIKQMLIEDYNRACGKESDLWHIEDFNLSSHRMNPSRDIKTLNFSCFSNEYNKMVLKGYIKYLFYHTEISLSFIYSKFISIKEFYKNLGDKKVNQLSRKDIEDFKSYLLNKDILESTYNIRIIHIASLLEYGLNKGLWSQNHIYIEYDLFKSSLNIKGDTVEPGVIEQILINRDKFSKRDFAMFLILYCCGMRISEVCTLKISDIKKDSRGYYITFYSQKMKKEASNPIPENLYEYLKEYSSEVIDKYGPNQEYMFTKNDGSVVLANTFKESMKKEIIKLNIKNSDGSMYFFRPHEFRHTFATNLVNKNVPFSVIQKLLHHNSPEMSLVYTQLRDSKKREKYIEFVNILGKKSSYLFDDSEKDEKVYEVQWLKNNLKAQALPNGFCSLPVSLGVCPYANVCLTCEYFKSTKGHILILKKQLARTDALIRVLKEKNLGDQLKVNIEVKKNLERIIKSIEEGM